jgi:hypothetical protein
MDASLKFKFRRRSVEREMRLPAAVHQGRAALICLFVRG